MLVVRHDFMNNGRSPNAIGNMLLVNRPRGHPWHHGDADQRHRRTALPRHPARHSRPTLPTDTLDRASIVVGTVTVIPLRSLRGNYVLGFTRRRSRLGDAPSAHLAVHHSAGLNSVAFFEPVVGQPLNALARLAGTESVQADQYFDLSSRIRRRHCGRSRGLAIRRSTEFALLTR